MTKIILFKASWCGPCKVLKLTVDKVMSLYPALQYEVIDVDKNEDLVNKYQIMSVPTLIKEVDGEVIARSTGNINYTEVMKFVNYAKPEN